MIKIMKYGVVSEDEIFSRSSSSKDVSSVVSSIIKDVKTRGDEALREYTKKLDGADISEIEVSKEEIKAAVEKIFNVQVVAVRTLNFQGKVRRTARGFGKRSDWKKAYVTLPAGTSVDFESAVQASKESK